MAFAPMDSADPAPADPITVDLARSFACGFRTGSVQPLLDRLGVGSLGVAQEQSASLGPTRPLVRFQPPRPVICFFWM